MKIDAAHVLGKVRRLCFVIEESTPVWVRQLFSASLFVLLIGGMDIRAYGLDKIYIILNYVIAASTGAFIFIRAYGGSRDAAK
jgi:hypothetical protein